MNRLQRSAVISALADELIKKGSLCAETHLQRSIYFLQTLFDDTMGFEFVMYKNGPLSFELRDEITAMLADCLLCMLPEDPDGPKLVPTEQSAHLRERYGRTVGHFAVGIGFVADKLAKLDVPDLERSATALYVERQLEGKADESRLAARIRELRPHVSYEDALQALNFIIELEKEARERTKSAGERFEEVTTSS